MTAPGYCPAPGCGRAWRTRLPSAEFDEIQFRCPVGHVWFESCEPGPAPPVPAPGVPRRRQRESRDRLRPRVESPIPPGPPGSLVDRLAACSPVEIEVAGIAAKINAGLFDEWLEYLLAVGHDRKRALRGTPGFPRGRR